MDESLSRREWMGSTVRVGLMAVGMRFSNPTAVAGPSAKQVQMDQPFDVHQHLEASEDIFSDFAAAATLIRRDYAIRTEIMDENGIGQSVMMVSTQYNKARGIENTKKLNDLVATYVEKHSDRFPVGIGTVEPTHGEVSLKELERMARDLKFRGVVWHHAHAGVSIDDPLMRPLLKQMAALDLIPFIHVYRKPLESLWMLEALAGEFPALTFVGLAGFAGVDDRAQALHVLKRTTNILFDTGPVFWRGEPAVESFVESFGSDRLLFGSDLYAMRPSYRRASTTLDIVRNSRIIPEDKAKILYGNTRKLLKV